MNQELQRGIRELMTDSGSIAILESEYLPKGSLIRRGATLVVASPDVIEALEIYMKRSSKWYWKLWWKIKGILYSLYSIIE